MYDYDQTIELLQRAVAEKGDGHISDCVYVENDMPACIVGHVLSYVGLLNGVDKGLVQELQVVRSNFTSTAIQALDAAQAAQDGCLRGKGVGKTWGEALIAAKGVLS